MNRPPRPASVAAQTAGAQRRVIPFIAVAMLSLLVGLWAGLARIGWALPAAGGDLMLRHGGLMVVGFAGTVIAVERAVAVRSLPAFAAPAASAGAGLALILGAPQALAVAFAAAAAAAYTLNLGILLRRQPQVGALALFGGGLCLLVAAGVWWVLGRYSSVVPWWMAFFVLTIAGERLELTRFRRIGPAALAAGAVGFALIVAGPAVAHADGTLGGRLLGAGMLLTAAWSAQRDQAQRTLRGTGLARFAAVGVLAAYLWLALTGAMLLAWGLEVTPSRYDAMVHTFFTGFMFAAIIAHEPIIAPAISGRRFLYSPVLYVPLAVLGAGLVLRIAGDLMGEQDLRRWSGLVQFLALLLLLAATARALLRGHAEEQREHREQRSPGGARPHRPHPPPR